MIKQTTGDEAVMLTTMIHDAEMDALRDAVQEAHRFLSRAEALAARKARGNDYQLRERSSAYRASLDLSAAFG